MDKKTALESVSKFKRAIESRGIRIKKLVLFGSYSTGYAREESDIDIVAISDDFAGKGYWERIEIISDAIYEVFAPLEVVGMTTEEWEKEDSFIAAYAKNGEVLYAA